MQRETYLPAGMEGVIPCPVQADPPVIYVNWTKDGNQLDLDNVSVVSERHTSPIARRRGVSLSCLLIGLSLSSVSWLDGEQRGLRVYSDSQ